MTVDIAEAETTLDRILSSSLTTDNADAALAELLSVAATINAAMSDRPSAPASTPRASGLPDRLAAAVGKFREAAQRIGQALKASQVTIQVGVPLGVNVGLTFPVEDTN
ncbi:MAG: hypothetical protein BGO26_04670 [Actinobacteria bacterium 69-20]|jgi:hypothetical protein|nr:hypothetical protein [Actinomycetota bacterium]OJV26893.1 MAG: hypothetical protein BGO26_04670 [Actinobacteria bacterium 69-20]